LDLLNIVIDTTNNEAFRELVTSISECKSLKTLELESYNNGVEEPTTAPMFRSFRSKFQELKVRFEDFDNQVIVAYSSFNDFLQSCTNLISSDLGDINEDRTAGSRRFV
jgi:hypothetical protein